MAGPSAGTNNFSASYWQNIIEEVWTDEIGKGSMVYKEYLSEKTIKKKYVEYGEVAGPGLWGQTGEVTRLVASPPAAQHLTSDIELSTQRRQWHALLVQSHQLGSKHRVIRHTTHASPPRVASYG